MPYYPLPRPERAGTRTPAHRDEWLQQRVSGEPAAISQLEEGFAVPGDVDVVVDAIFGTGYCPQPSPSLFLPISISSHIPM